MVETVRRDVTHDAYVSGTGAAKRRCDLIIINTRRYTQRLDMPLEHSIHKIIRGFKSRIWLCLVSRTCNRKVTSLCNPCRPLSFLDSSHHSSVHRLCHLDPSYSFSHCSTESRVKLGFTRFSCIARLEVNLGSRFRPLTRSQAFRMKSHSA